MKIINTYQHFRYGIACALCMVFFISSANAQAPNIFQGGQSSGSAMAMDACAAVNLNTSAGGGGDGAAMLVDACNLIAFNIFKGDASNGSAKVYNACPPVNINVFAGGAHTGSNAVYQNCSITTVNILSGGSSSGSPKVYNSCPAVTLNLFGGGSYDGHSVNSLQCPAAANPLVGGSGDGAASIYSSCSAVLTNVFGGGSSAGSPKVWSTCNTISVNILKGGVSDGSAAQYKSCPQTLVNLFAGGSYSGYSSEQDYCNTKIVNVVSGGADTGSVKIWDACLIKSVNYNRGGSCSGAFALASVCSGTWISKACVCLNCCPIPLAAGNITGPTVVCENAKGVTFSIAPVQDATGYQWVLPSGANIASGGNTNTIKVNFSGNTNPAVISVFGTSPCGNGNPSADFNFSFKPLPAKAGSISGNTSVCQGENNVNYSISPIPNATSYVWTLPSAATIVSGANTNSITVDFGTTAVSGNITVSGADSCGSGQSSSLSISVTDLPYSPGTISGKVNVCQSENGVVYSVSPVSNATSYNWTLPTGASIVSGANTNSVTVDFSSSASSGDISVEAINTCGTGQKSTLSITADKLPGNATTISGNTTACQSEKGVVFSVSPITDATSYNWTLPAGANIVSGANTNSIAVDFSSSAVSGNITVEGTNACGKGQSSMLGITLNNLPDTAGSITGNTNVCQSDNGLVYSVVPIANATSYNWIVPTGASIVSGANTNSITLDFSASSVTGTISVEGVNACGVGQSTTANIVVNTVPDASGPITGNTSVCQSEKGVIYTLSPVANATSYNWTLPAGATIVSGANTNSITVDFSASAVSGDIIAEGLNACGSGQSSQLSILVNTLPQANAGADQTICVGQSVSLGGLPASGINYSWSPSLGLDDANSSNPLASPTSTTVYTLTESNALTACYATASVTVTVNTNPSPQITVNGSTLETGSAASYQWYLNGGIITGATSQTYLPASSGDYTVEVSDINQCMGVSAPYNVIITNNLQLLAASNIQVYPNPHTASFNISGKTFTGDQLKIKLMNVHNQEILKLQIPDGSIFNESVQTTHLPSGVYMLTIQTTKGLELKKIIKIQ